MYYKDINLVVNLSDCYDCNFMVVVPLPVKKPILFFVFGKIRLQLKTIRYIITG